MPPSKDCCGEPQVDSVSRSEEQLSRNGRPLAAASGGKGAAHLPESSLAGRFPRNLHQGFDCGGIALRSSRSAQAHWKFVFFTSDSEPLLVESASFDARTAGKAAPPRSGGARPRVVEGNRTGVVDHAPSRVDSRGDSLRMGVHAPGERRSAHDECGDDPVRRRALGKRPRSLSRLENRDFARLRGRRRPTEEETFEGRVVCVPPAGCSNTGEGVQGRGAGL